MIVDITKLLNLIVTYLEHQQAWISDYELMTVGHKYLHSDAIKQLCKFIHDLRIHLKES